MKFNYKLYANYLFKAFVYNPCNDVTDTKTNYDSVFKWFHLCYQLIDRLNIQPIVYVYNSI